MNVAVPGTFIVCFKTVYRGKLFINRGVNYET